MVRLAEAVLYVSLAPPGVEGGARQVKKVRLFRPQHLGGVDSNRLDYRWQRR